MVALHLLLAAMGTMRSPSRELRTEDSGLYGMSVYDGRCDLCGKTAERLEEFGQVALCGTCAREIVEAAKPVGVSIPQGCERRFLFYRWLRITGRINEDQAA